MLDEEEFAIAYKLYNGAFRIPDKTRTFKKISCQFSANQMIVRMIIQILPPSFGRNRDLSQIALTVFFCLRGGAYRMLFFIVLCSFRHGS